ADDWRGGGMTAPHTMLTPTRHGLMAAFTCDAYVGASLIAYGEFSQHEVEFLAPYIGPTDLVIDVGANIGALTIPLARIAGQVLAFEPQRGCFELLVANKVLNNLTNIAAHQMAVGDGSVDTITVPIVDYTKPGNFGALELGDATHGEHVPCV